MIKNGDKQKKDPNRKKKNRKYVGVFISPSDIIICGDLIFARSGGGGGKLESGEAQVDGHIKTVDRILRST